MTKEQQDFVNKIAPLVQKIAPKYNIKVCSPIIAQAILESGWGKSELGAKAHNYFGLKYKANRCPTSNGKVNKVGSEQNADGSYVSSEMVWFKFPTMEAGVYGYFDFTNSSRYSNLKGVTDPRTYLENIKSDGYATSLKYVDNLMNVINKNNLTQYDSGAKLEPESNKLYRVQVGAYKIKTNAEDMLKKLEKAGFKGIIVEVEK